MRIKLLLILFLMVGIVVSFLPIIRVSVVPSWQLKVVDSAGVPLKNEPVRQTWKDYSLEIWTIGEHEETIATDSNGMVAFPERFIGVSPAIFISARISDALPLINPHESRGKSSFVFCLDRGGCNVFYREGDPLPQVMVAR